MRTIEKRQIMLFGKKIVIALGISLFFALLAIFAQLGYFGTAHTEVRERQPSGYWLVDASCNISYNPFLYAFSWSTGRGQFSDDFLMVSAPTYVGGGDIRYPVWRKPADLEEEAILLLVLRETFINIPFNFVAILAIELTKTHDLYFCLLGGIVGFPIGKVVGSIVGFSVGALLILFVLPRLKKNPHVVDLWNWLLEREKNKSDVHVTD